MCPLLPLPSSKKREIDGNQSSRVTLTKDELRKQATVESCPHPAGFGFGSGSGSGSRQRNHGACSGFACERQLKGVCRRELEAVQSVQCDASLVRSRVRNVEPKSQQRAASEKAKSGIYHVWCLSIDAIRGRVWQPEKDSGGYGGCADECSRCTGGIGTRQSGRLRHRVRGDGWFPLSRKRFRSRHLCQLFCGTSQQQRVSSVLRKKTKKTQQKIPYPKRDFFLFLHRVERAHIHFISPTPASGPRTR